GQGADRRAPEPIKTSEGQSVLCSLWSAVDAALDELDEPVEGMGSRLRTTSTLTDDTGGTGAGSIPGVAVASLALGMTGQRARTTARCQRRTGIASIPN